MFMIVSFVSSRLCAHSRMSVNLTDLIPQMPCPLRFYSDLIVRNLTLLYNHAVEITKAQSGFLG